MNFFFSPASPCAREEAEPLMLRAADAMFHLILVNFLGARSRRSYNARLDTSPPMRGSSLQARQGLLGTGVSLCGRPSMG